MDLFNFIFLAFLALCLFAVIALVLRGDLLDRVKTQPMGELGGAELGSAVPQLALRPPILLGYSSAGEMLEYDGEGHLLTLGHTRSGKGVGAIIPNLLEYPGSVIIFDPKGENTVASIKKRRDMGQNVLVMDPWNITGHNNSTYDPLSVSDASDDLAVEDARLIADAIVVPGALGLGQGFWEEEARNLISTILLFLMLDRGSKASTGGWSMVRQLLGELARLDAYLSGLVASPLANGALARGAAQYLDKVPNERSAVLSTARQQTAFLNSMDILGTFRDGGFRFSAVRDMPTTVYFVMPVWRLPTYGRWLRIVVSMAVTELSRAPGKSKVPVLFVLDEFASFGQLQAFDVAYAMMAGYGVQLWPILQDFNQLTKLYGQHWQTFVANAAVIQSFGTRDLLTANYLSDRVGSTTIPLYEKSASYGRDSVQTVSSRLAQRPLLFPEEITRMDTGKGLLLVENAAPVIFEKVQYFCDGRFTDGFPLGPLNVGEPLPIDDVGLPLEAHLALQMR